jgi:hypothetical protein
MIEMYMIITVCLLSIGSNHALALEVFESPEGEVIEIKSQDELAEALTDINLTESGPAYLLIDSEPCFGCKGKNVGGEGNKYCCCKKKNGAISTTDCGNYCDTSLDCGDETRVGGPVVVRVEILIAGARNKISTP